MGECCITAVLVGPVIPDIDQRAAHIEGPVVGDLVEVTDGRPELGQTGGRGRPGPPGLELYRRVLEYN